MSTISDLSTEVVLRTENRASDVARTYVWLRDALIEITTNPDFRSDFDELEVLGSPFVLTGGTTAGTSVQEYDYSNFLSAPDLCAATLDFFIWRDPPYNTQRTQLLPSHYQDSDKAIPTPSTPVEWYRFGNAIGFNPIPDKNYQVQARCLRMHPIASPIQNTTVLLAQDWNEVLIWAAAERGFMELLEYEKAGKIHTLLYGDPKYPARPGLLNGRKKRREREAWRVQQALRPVVRGYGWGRS